MIEILSFISNKEELNFSLSFTDLTNIKVNFGDTYSCLLYNTKIANIYHYYADSLIEHTITVEVDKSDYVDIINIANCGVSNFNTPKLTNLNKLACYNNENLTLENAPALENIKENYPNLQYLHIFNTNFINENNLTTIFNNLPDRNNNAFGSIIMYPFYPLGIFIEIEDDKYYKYPKVLVKTKDNLNGTYKEVILEENQYYRDMSSETTSWYQYKNGTLIPQDNQNQLIELRKQLENITLLKKWLFGSAIQYDPAYSKCDFYFKQNHVQDYWETSEQGEGITLGMLDQFSLKTEEIDNLNIVGFLNWQTDITNGLNIIDKNEDNIYLHKNNPIEAQENHGNLIIGSISNRGIYNYGVAPNLNYLLLRGNEIQYNNTINNKKIAYNTLVSILTEYSDIISNSLLIGSQGIELNNYNDKSESDYYSLVKSYYENFGLKKPLLSALGNFGDGRQYESESAYIYDLPNRFGSNSLMISALTSSTKTTSFSTTIADYNIDNPLTPETDTYSYQYSYKDCFSQYGENMLVEHLDNQEKDFYKRTRYVGGTSVSTPLCSGILALMMNVYKKLYTLNSPEAPVSLDENNNILYGKSSNFINYFIKNHTDPLKNEMSKTVGYGRPDLMYYNPIGKILEENEITSDNISHITLDNINNDINKIEINFDNGTEINSPFISNYNNHFSTNNLMDKIAIMNNKLYPLKDFEDFNLVLYPNLSYSFDTNLKKEITITLNQNFNLNNIQAVLNNINLIPLNNSFNIVNTTEIKKDNIFTIQFKEKYPTTKPANNSSIIYFKTLDEIFQTSLEIVFSSTNVDQLRLIQKNNSSVGLISSKFGTSNDYNDYANKEYIYTLIVNKNKTKFYINSNLVHESILRIPLLLSEINFNNNYDFLVYNRILKEQEILQNTRYLLNKQD